MTHDVILVADSESDGGIIYIDSIALANLSNPDCLSTEAIIFKNRSSCGDREAVIFCTGSGILKLTNALFDYKTAFDDFKFAESHGGLDVLRDKLFELME